jgi:hypothetical protein
MSMSKSIERFAPSREPNAQRADGNASDPLLPRNATALQVDRATALGQIRFAVEAQRLMEEPLRSELPAPLGRTGKKQPLDRDPADAVPPEFIAAFCADQFIASMSSPLVSLASSKTAPHHAPAPLPAVAQPPASESGTVSVIYESPCRSTAFVTLSHPALGRIRLQMSISGSSLDVTAFVSRPLAVDHIAQSESHLRENLAAQGIELRTLRIQSDKPRGKAARRAAKTKTASSGKEQQ